MELEAQLDAILRDSPTLMQVLKTVRGLGLPDWRLMSGAVYQSVWNALTGREPDYGVRDYDIAYFDPDPSWEAEDLAIRRAASALPAPLSETVEVRNQARVHLWYPHKFGRPYPALKTTDECLVRALATAHAVGVRLEPDGRIDVAAPYGLEDMFALTLRPAPLCNAPAVFADKARSSVARWPEVRVVD